jgi:hypothetical protein
MFIMRVLLCQLDGEFPNHALMRVAVHHRERGDDVELRHIGNVQAASRRLLDDFGAVYASAVFEWSRPVAARILEIYPHAFIGGPGWDDIPDAAGKLVSIATRLKTASVTSLEGVGITTAKKDYSFWPLFKESIGFTMRGCRMSCGFCKVPVIEGKAHADETIHNIWRGDPYPKHLILWDNDTFGSPNWRQEFASIRDGGFKVSFNQGVNARLMNDENAEALASMPCYNAKFTDKRWYTAWDNKDDEEILFRGLNRLVRYGVKPYQIMVYMLIGYWPGESHEDREQRRNKLLDFGVLPYPMVYRKNPNQRELSRYARWVIRRLYKVCSWEDYKPETCGKELRDPFGLRAAV